MTRRPHVAAILVAAAATVVGIGWRTAPPEPAAAAPVSATCTGAGYSRAQFGNEPTTSTRAATYKRLAIPGGWVDFYTAEVHPSRRGLQVDHVLSLRDAWLSGACHWTPAQRRAFARDPANLVVTRGAVNESKGDDTPPVWEPRWAALAKARRWPAPSTARVCMYETAYAQVRATYRLPVTVVPREGCPLTPAG